MQGIRDSIKTFQAKKQTAQNAALTASAAEAQRAKEVEQTAARERLALAKQKQEEAENTSAREEQDRLDRQRRERAESKRLEDQATWQEAANAHSIEAYETYLYQFPQGSMARKALSCIKELKRQNDAPIPWGRYAAIGGGVLALVLIIWLAPKFFGGSQLQPPGSSLTPDMAKIRQFVTDFPKQDSTKPAPIEPPKQDPAAKSAGMTPSQPGTTPAFTDPFEGQMLRVAGGTFTMGSPTTEQDRSDNECQHQVSVGSFFMSKYEVTQAQWKAVMGSNPSGHKGCGDCPVEKVSWNDVQAFIKTLNRVTKNKKKYRLPSESEWEYAAKGGIKSQGSTYAGGNTLGRVAWYAENAGQNTHPVGGKNPNELGLCNMSGNVWEWCQDLGGPYSCDGKTTADTWGRVFRGGSMSGSSLTCRSACRGMTNGTFEINHIGFRLAKN